MSCLRSLKTVRKMCADALREQYGESYVLYFDHRESKKYAAVYYDKQAGLLLVESMDVSATPIVLSVTALQALPEK